MNKQNDGILLKINIDARTELLHDLFGGISTLLNKSDEKIEKLVEVLKDQKEAIGHGGWLDYLRDTFGGEPAVKRVQYYMRKVDQANSRIFNYLDGEPETEPEPDAPRAERKTGQVEVVEPSTVGQTAVQADEPDDDPTPDPPTTRKTAKGTENVKEADKPKTPPITPEILDEPKESFPEETTLSDWTEAEILTFLETTADDPKRRSKAMRKSADKLDPPTKFVKPDLADVVEYLIGYADSDEFKEDKGPRTEKQVKAAARGFLDHFEGNGWITGKAKASVKDWRATARKWLRNEGQFEGGNSNGRRTENTGAVNTRPPVERAKINFK